MSECWNKITVHVVIFVFRASGVWTDRGIVSPVLDEHEEEEEDEFVVDLFHHPLSHPHKYGVINRSMKIYQPDADSVLSIRKSQPSLSLLLSPLQGTPGDQSTPPLH